MPTEADLRYDLDRLDGRGYKAYRDLEDIRYDFEDLDFGDLDFGDPGVNAELAGKGAPLRFALRIDRAQADPFAAPSACRVRVPADAAAFPEHCTASPIRQIALRDYLTRQFARAADRGDRGGGSGKSGLVAIARPGQAILARSAMVLLPSTRGGFAVEARFAVGLPAFGRRIAGRQAETLLCDRLPEIVARSLRFAALDPDRLREHLDTAEDSHWLRSQLAARGLVAFVPDGARLPRRSGADDRPAAGAVVPFQSPESLRTQFDCPHAGPISGLGVPRGITLLVGGGYHGKSTLLQAIERGIYNHCPGDGRERVATDPGAVKIRAEDGRSIAGTDISPFIDNLPQGQSTRAFSTANASGSTSQAAAIVEALEAGATTLLADEDTCATNFMVRDRRMQALIAKDREPIVPLLDKIRALYAERGTSWVLVMGGSGDYLDVADTVVALDDYQPWDATEAARAVARQFPTGRTREGGDRFGSLTPRRPDPNSLDPSRGKRSVKWTVRDVRSLAFGTDDIDLSAIAQLVETGQVRAIAAALVCAKTQWLRNGATVADLLDRLEASLAADGLDGLGSGYPSGDFAAFRRFEFAAALNRLRSLRVR